MRDIIKVKQTLRKETDMNQELLEPLKFYKNTGRARHEENARQYLDELIARSGIDIAANHATVKKYRAQEAAAEKIAKRIRLYKTLRVLLIIAAVLGGIVALLSVISFTENDAAGGAIKLGIGAVVIFGSLVLIFKVINPKIKDASALHEKHLEKARKEEKHIGEQEL